VSFFFFLGFYFFYRNPGEDKRLTHAEREYIKEGGAQPEGVTTASNVGAALLYLLKQRKVWGLTIGFAAYGYSFYFLLTWLPGYLVDTYHMDIIRTGAYAMVPWIVAAIADLIVGGWLVDYLIKRGADPNRVRKTIIVIGMLMGLTIIGAAYTTNPNLAILWITIGLTGLACSAPIGWSIPALIAPKGSVGSIGGIMNFFNNVMAILAPIATGYIAKNTGSFADAFITAAIVLLFGIASYVWILGRIAPIPDPA
jgi:ACS family D-galactonate transporter-like MFS transporter